MKSSAAQAVRELIVRIGKLRDTLQAEANRLGDVKYNDGVWAEYENGAEEADQIAKQLETLLPSLESADPMVGLVGADTEVQGIDPDNLLRKFSYQGLDNSTMQTANVGAWYHDAVYWKFRALHTQQAVAQARVDERWRVELLSGKGNWRDAVSPQFNTWEEAQRRADELASGSRLGVKYRVVRVERDLAAIAKEPVK